MRKSGAGVDKEQFHQKAERTNGGTVLNNEGTSLFYDSILVTAAAIFNCLNVKITLVLFIAEISHPCVIAYIFQMSKPDGDQALNEYIQLPVDWTVLLVNDDDALKQAWYVRTMIPSSDSVLIKGFL